MAKTKSTFHKTFFPDEDASDVLFDTNEFKPPTLPNLLNRPLVLEKELIEQYRAVLRRSGGAAEIWGMAELAAHQVQALREKWIGLFVFYGIDANEDSWKRLAIALAQDFVPGVRVELKSPSDAALEDAKKARLIVKTVSDELQRLRGNKESVSVPEAAALRSFYEGERKNWPEIFGDRPDTQQAFNVRFVREKEKAARSLMTYGLSKDEIIQAFSRSGLEAPAFLSERDPLSLANLPITSATKRPL